MLGKRKFAATTATTPTAAMDGASPALDMGQAPTNALKIPRYVQYTSPVSTAAPQPMNGAPQAATLPLNLIALIVSHLEDIGDIARVTRTSRLLYYMTLPSLYEKVHLHSYGDIRYLKNGRPEGFGSGSPLMMALNGLVTRQHATLVRELRLFGCWKELGIEDFAKGRVPDNSMMLNTLLRAATDKMDKLQTFSWELDCKPLKTLYQGLASHNTLTSLTLRFPSTRVPRPSVLIPPIPQLRAFKVLDIDPLCYPDDISMLLLHSKKLEDLRLHFSPRMRQESESTLNLTVFFGRCVKANHKIRLKHFAMHNFFGPNTIGFHDFIDNETAQSICFLDSFGNRDPKTIFVDSTWNEVPPDVFTQFERMRFNEVATQHIQIMKQTKSKIKYFFLVNEKRKKSGFTPPESANSPFTPSASTDTPSPDPEVIALMPEYIHTLTRYHGDSLRHLLLLEQWALSPEDVAEIVQYCPNLEQFGLALNTSDHNALRLLMPFLTNLRVLRILQNEHLEANMRSVSHEERMWVMGYELASKPFCQLKIVAFGDNVIYKIGKIVELVREDGTTERRHELSFADKAEAMKYDIWRLDCLDINVDPVAPFSP